VETSLDPRPGGSMLDRDWILSTAKQTLTSLTAPIEFPRMTTKSFHFSRRRFLKTATATAAATSLPL
jgi:hypothetical protein